MAEGGVVLDVPLRETFAWVVFLIGCGWNGISY